MTGVAAAFYLRADLLERSSQASCKDEVVSLDPPIERPAAVCDASSDVEVGGVQYENLVYGAVLGFSRRRWISATARFNATKKQVNQSRVQHVKSIILRKI